MTNAAAQVGDRLVLTKPIGSGVLTSAAKADKIEQADLDEAVDVMTDLNAGACEAMLEVGVRAATDITGFGLIGHAHEMGAAGHVTMELDAAAVPLLERTLQLARAGGLTRTHKATVSFLGKRLRADGVDETLLGVLADAQTSGGLLICVPENRVDQLVEGLKKRQTRAAAVVGRVTDRSDQTVVLR